MPSTPDEPRGVLASGSMPDGRTLLVDGRLGRDWHLELEGVADAEVVGSPLNAALADLLGYRVGTEDWPEWVDRLAEDIARSLAAGN
jgi:hypothetical protein